MVDKTFTLMAKRGEHSFAFTMPQASTLGEAADALFELLEVCLNGMQKNKEKAVEERASLEDAVAADSDVESN